MTNEEIIRVWRHCEAQKKCIDCKASIDVGHCLTDELETGDLVNRIEALMAENERLKTNAHANGTAPIVGQSGKEVLTMANERRLIDANELREDWLLYGANENIYSTNDALESIDETPTVDAVEVVRCKDCKWYKTSELFSPQKFCYRLKHPTEDRKVGYLYEPDGFCSYGEKSGTQPQREDV